MVLSPVLQALKLLTLSALVVALTVEPVIADATDDRDGDGVVDTVDLDDDNDGIPDVLEIDASGQERDSDGDGIPDRLDLDSDNDGILDVAESGLFVSLSFTGIRIVNGRLLTEVGENGIADFLETFTDSNTPAYSLQNTDEADGDVVPDYLDLDSDNDGILDLVEAGVTGELDSDRNGRIDAGPGSVGNDGILDLVQINNDQNCCDYDLDGVGDQIPRNTDGGDFPDFQDLDSDNDGFNDLIEAGGNDIDQDGRIDSFFDDANNPDGVDDQLFLIPLPIPDSDGDGLPDFRDSVVQFAPEQVASAPEPEADVPAEVAPVTDIPADAGEDQAEPDTAVVDNPPATTSDVTPDDNDADGTQVFDDDVDTGIIETGLVGGVGCSISWHGASIGMPRDPVFFLMLLVSSLFLGRPVRRFGKRG